jgi:hypothetical protein
MNEAQASRAKELGVELHELLEQIYQMPQPAGVPASVICPWTEKVAFNLALIKGDWPEALRYYLYINHGDRIHTDALGEEPVINDAFAYYLEEVRHTGKPKNLTEFYGILHCVIHRLFPPRVLDHQQDL